MKGLAEKLLTPAARELPARLQVEGLLRLKDKRRQWLKELFDSLEGDDAFSASLTTINRWFMEDQESPNSRRPSLAARVAIERALGIPPRIPW